MKIKNILTGLLIFVLMQENFCSDPNFQASKINVIKNLNSEKKPFEGIFFVMQSGASNKSSYRKRLVQDIKQTLEKIDKDELNELFQAHTINIEKE